MAGFGKVLIFGDSYSTFAGHIPDGYEPWYDENPRGATGVNHLEQTWWYQLIHQTDSELLRNDSWSGTTICHTGYSGDCSERSFVGRMERLNAEGYFADNIADTIFVFGGTNDSWADSPIGELQYADWTREDLFSVLPAACHLLHRLREIQPQARIITVVNTELKPVITNGLIAASDHYGVQTVVMTELDKLNGHPSILGMTQIKDQIINECL